MKSIRRLRFTKVLYYSIITPVILFLVVPSSIAQTIIGQGQGAPTDQAGRQHTLSPNQSSQVTHGKVELQVEAGAVDKVIAIAIDDLSDEDLTELDQGMTNVTGGTAKGYRFHPDGMKFKKKVKLSLPYDRTLIPAGLSEKDIKTLYYDEELGRWLELECVSVDTKLQVVVSLTDHFTDMVNATVTVPDHPEVLAYAPTAIKDLKAADPGAGINLIEAPKGDNMGDATLSYPIQVPPGRDGVQPQLVLAYSSGGSNGWMGMGWGLTLPAITVDTRWGVPRYSQDATTSGKESETYLLNGEQLTPLAHRDAMLEDRTVEKVFHTRIEGQFLQIVRHGDDPTNYWWELTDKSGTRYFYGGDPDTGAPLDACTLRDGQRNIFRWALREVRDLNGNGIRYDYELVSHEGIPGVAAAAVQQSKLQRVLTRFRQNLVRSVDGRQLYPKRINYTQFNGAPGPYAVRFFRDDEIRDELTGCDPTKPGCSERQDVTIDCRGGFQIVTASLLKRIDVTYDDQLVRRYDLNYKEGAFKKTLLEEIVQRGDDSSVFNVHRFSYFDDVRSTGSYAFGENEDWETGNDRVTAGLLPLPGLRASAISGARGDSKGGHIYIGYNPTTMSKTLSGGVKVGYNSSSTESHLGLFDINGDNLPDKVMRAEDDNVFAVRFNRSKLNPSTPFGSKVAVHNLPSVMFESSDMFSGGGEAFFHVNAFVNVANTVTNGVAYMADVNADGLTDAVVDGRVFYNHLNANREPTFELAPTNTPVPIDNGLVDTNNILADFTALREQMIDTFPLHDTFRRWVAPFNGNIQITGDVSIEQDTSEERAQYETADGVRVAIQHNGAELWYDILEADELGAVTPTDVSSVPVQRGDRLYFRVQSRFDGAYDQVHWDPEIEYLDVAPRSDVNGQSWYSYRPSRDFTLAGREPYVWTPFTGIVRVAGNLHKNAVTTDDVKLEVLKNDVVLFSQQLAWDQVGEIPLSQDVDVMGRSSASRGDSLMLRVRVDSPVDVTALSWQPEIYYVSSPELPQIVDENGNYVARLVASYDIDTYPRNEPHGPQTAWIAQYSDTLTVFSDVSVRNGLFVPRVDGEVILTAKRPGELLGKGRIEVRDNDATNVSFKIYVEEGDIVYFDYSCRDRALAELVEHAEVSAEYEGRILHPRFSVPSVYHRRFVDAEDCGNFEECPLGRGMFAQPYRGWTFGGYNGNRARAEAPIVELDLILPDPDDIEIPDSCREEGRNCPNLKEKAFPFTSFPTPGIWRGPDELGWVSATTISSSRLGLDSFKLPNAGELSGERAVPRFSTTTQVTEGAGVSLFSGSTTFPRASSYSDLEYLDLNGDRYPDIVSSGSNPGTSVGRVQYSTPRGGLEAANREVTNLGRVRETSNRATNYGIGGSAANVIATSKAIVGLFSKNFARGDNTGSQMPALGLGISTSWSTGDTEVRRDLVDMNGDGLPDVVVDNDGALSVSLNLGYQYASPRRWADNASISDGSSNSHAVGPTLGFGDLIFGWGGGASLGANDSRTDRSLTDMNGDGLPDLLWIEGDHLRVSFNTGNGFASPVNWNGANSVGTSRNSSFGGGAYITFGIPLCYFGCWLIINPGGDVGQNMSRQESALVDVDGDGYVDYVTSTSDELMHVSSNSTGRTNLLREVTRPLGAVIALDYSREGNTYDQPQSQWALSRVVLKDGHPGDGVDSLVSTYQYESGHYDRLERAFYGYAKVIEQQRDARNVESVYRSIVREYLNDTYYAKGLVKRETSVDGNNQPFLQTEHTYVFRDVATRMGFPSTNSLTGTFFPELTRTDRRFYEGSSVALKSTFVTTEYDEHGNVTRHFDVGDIGIADDLAADIEYSQCFSSRVLGTPVRIVVSSDGVILRERSATIDCDTGNVTRISEYLSQGQAAITDLAYSERGNLESVEGPPNRNGQRYLLEFEYDPIVQTHVTRVRDIFGYTSSATHDLHFGLPLSETDSNSNTVSRTYDNYGRIATIVAPYEQGEATPTIRFVYHPEASPPSALTQHLDKFRDVADPIETVMFTDGMKRALQTKKDASLFTGPATATEDVMLVSGHLTYDHVGRVIEKYHPVTESKGNASTSVFNPTIDTVQPTRMAYDILDRITLVTIPDNTATATAYGFGPDRQGLTQFETSVTDANGVAKKTYRNVRDLIVALREFHNGGSESIWTSYAYDALDQIREIQDDQNNLIRVGYDNLGRRTIFELPDAGRTETLYDLASNVIGTVTPNLRMLGRQITYDYDFKRLKSISYPEFSGNNVSYTYGLPGATDNRAGRIVKVTNQSGSTERFYGKLGEITKETRTVASHTQGGGANSPEVYTTQYLYDSWGRLQTLTYPDGEVLTYRYDSGGQVRAAAGLKAGNSYDYLNRLEYDKFEERQFSRVGNGVTTLYAYNPENRRLVALQTQSEARLFQDLAYTYDKVGNVLSVENRTPAPPPPEFGGHATQTYEYDDLYRLISADGTYEFAPDKASVYSLDIEYDSIDNILSKTQEHDIVQPHGARLEQKETTYDWAYEYDATPHAATHIGLRSFNYDANGNQSGWTHDRNGTRRSTVWDEENRVQSIFDQGHEKSYKYDDTDERIVKRGPQGETAYVNQYLTVRNRETGTKHVYVGNMRIASKLMKQPKPGSQNVRNVLTLTDGASGFTYSPPPGTAPYEKDVYFLHTDHLGGTNFVTDAKAKIYEHLEYFPFGEIWVDESTNIQRNAYLFTGKELDEETGLYYFGARYYDPRTSQWQATDPLFEKYVPSAERRRDESLPGAGGVYNARNLNDYAYVHQSPLAYIDPDGRGVFSWFRENVWIPGVDDADEIDTGRTLKVVVGVALTIAPLPTKGIGVKLLVSAVASDQIASGVLGTDSYVYQGGETICDGCGTGAEIGATLGAGTAPLIGAKLAQRVPQAALILPNVSEALPTTAWGGRAFAKTVDVSPRAFANTGVTSRGGSVAANAGRTQPGSTSPSWRAAMSAREAYYGRLNDYVFQRIRAYQAANQGNAAPMKLVNQWILEAVKVTVP